MTPADAATSYASSFKNHLDTADQERLKEAFTKGLEWAVADPDVLREILGPFAEWIRTFEALERQNGQWVIESQLSDEQIVKAFIADNKNKQDENSRQG